jgi:hypothetical protein
MKTKLLTAKYAKYANGRMPCLHPVAVGRGKSNLVKVVSGRLLLKAGRIFRVLTACFAVQRRSHKIEITLTNAY